MDDSLERAASLIKEADSIIILAGAGMSADSGIPVYRGENGLWEKEAIVSGKSVSLSNLNTHKAFTDHYDSAWQFTIDRMRMISKAVPHNGYKHLRSICERKPYFVVTTNIDGYFERANFDETKIVEMHGSLKYFQCLELCEKDIWLMPETFSELPPKCPNCNGKTRPNVRFFEDWHWLSLKSRDQEKEYIEFIKKLKESQLNVVILEIGAGSKLPYLRQISEKLSKNNWPIIRVNPYELENKKASVSLNIGAENAMKQIAGLI